MFAFEWTQFVFCPRCADGDSPLPISKSGLFADPREDWLGLHIEDVIDPARPIIDPHHHLWDRRGQRYWVTTAGDTLFENNYLHEFTDVIRALRDSYDGSYERFWEDFRSGRPAFSKKSDHTLVNVWAMAAAYSGGELPFDVETGELRDDVWAQWLRWDPVRMAREERYAAALRGMRAIWIDAGRSDEFHLDLGAIAFHRATEAAGVDENALNFELHDGGHFNSVWRLRSALTFLAERLAE